MQTLDLRLSLLLLLTCCALTARAEQQKGTVTCVSCHAAEAHAQPLSPMGRAMQVSPVNTVLAAHPRLTLRKGNYIYSVTTRNGKGEYTVSDGAQTVSVPIVWAMGVHAQTWVLERNGELYESLVSYYPSINALDVTTGDERLAPKTVEEAIGRPIGMEEAKSCFSCHATNAVRQHELNLKSLEPGVGCEHCHLGATVHAAKIATSGDLTGVPSDLHKLSSEDMSNFCGQCHRTWEGVVRSHWRGQADVRFQPYRLANSRCYNGADARIGCVACHNPHDAVVRDIAYYDSKCLACHGQAASSDHAAEVQPKTCPVAKSRCASCHMPQISLPNGLLRFTDHQIRIVKPNEPYPN